MGNREPTSWAVPAMPTLPGWKSRAGLLVMALGRHSGATLRTVEVEVETLVTVVAAVMVFMMLGMEHLY